LRCIETLSGHQDTERFSPDPEESLRPSGVSVSHYRILSFKHFRVSKTPKGFLPTPKRL